MRYRTLFPPNAPFLEEPSTEPASQQPASVEPLPDRGHHPVAKAPLRETQQRGAATRLVQPGGVRCPRDPVVSPRARNHPFIFLQCEGLARQAEGDQNVAGLQGVAGYETTWIVFPLVMHVSTTRQ